MPRAMLLWSLLLHMTQARDAHLGKWTPARARAALQVGLGAALAVLSPFHPARAKPEGPRDRGLDDPTNQLMGH